MRSNATRLHIKAECIKFQHLFLTQDITMAQVKVMGHVPPDTDSVCSPIVYAWYLKNYMQIDATAFIGGEVNRETEFVLQHFNVAKPELITSVGEGDQLIIVDTNNPEELIKGYDQAEIIEIVDHHKLFGLTTASPVKITMRPVACVATVIWDIMSAEARAGLPTDMAGLMLACILSDTLKFTSPTTTDYDREVASILAKHIDVDIDQLAGEMFAAKSNLEGMSVREILLTDYKNAEFAGNKYKVAVLETTDPQQSLSKSTELLTEMQALRSEENLAGIFFFVVDILKTEATLLVGTDSEKELASKAFGVEFDGNTVVLPGVVSRKKQMLPKLENAIVG
jgi:manganese-dependent inorganic pyrophosphatase